MESQEKKARTILEKAYDAFIEIDIHSNVIDWNAQAETMFGWPRAEIIGKSLAETIIPPSFREAHLRGLKHYQASGEGPVINRKVEISALHRNGEEFPIELAVFPVSSDGVVTFCAFVRDIRDRKLAEKKQLALKEAERSNQELEQFAYVASHDLQEPLRAISGCLQILEKTNKEKLDDEAQQLMHHAIDGAIRMQALINDLLSLSRVSTGESAFEPVELSEVIKQALKNLEVTVQETAAVITYDTLPVLSADKTQLIQLFQNLIGNAIKFCSEKSPQIHISAEKQEGNWLFSIRDNGIGFDKKHAETIFQPFKRLHGRDKYRGTGMGLSICKRIVERHGGSISVDSEPGKGATFYFTMTDTQAQ